MFDLANLLNKRSELLPLVVDADTLMEVLLAEYVFLRS